MDDVTRLRAFRHGPLHRKHRHDAAALLEVFKSSYYAVSLNQWLALTPPEVVKAHLKLMRRPWPPCTRRSIQSAGMIGKH
jgi:hypothetical protein